MGGNSHFFDLDVSAHLNLKLVYTKNLMLNDLITVLVNMQLSWSQDACL